MSKKKPTVKPRKKAKTPSTALAIRQRDQAVRTPEVLPAERRGLNDEISIGELGLVELKLTPEEEGVLSEQVPVSRILVKPQSAFTPYLSHPEYTRWFNRAFGRLGWAIAPAAKPMKSERSIICPYVLYIHGRPVAFAMGEQDYFESNKDQSYGDALESTVASALRRCAKRMGVGLELWDRRWVEAFKQRYCVKVKLEDGKKVWRRKDETPVWNEVKPTQRRVQAPAEPVETAFDAEVYEGDIPEPAAPRPTPPPPPARADKSPPTFVRPRGQVITEKQRKRLWAIVQSSGRDELEVKGWLHRKYKFDGYASVTMDVYDAITRAVEAPGDLL
jgi:hypothetical protein